MVKSKETELTNETLATLFSDNFQLALTAIRLAQHDMEAGHAVTLQSVLATIKKHPNTYTFVNRALVQDFEVQE